MKLFKVEVVQLEKRRGLDVVVHAADADQARGHVASKYTGWKVRNCIEIYGPVHFVTAEWSTD